MVIEEVTLEDQKPEYIIEVKASEAPSKSELASAIASIEDPNDLNDPNYDPNDPNYDPDDPNYDPNEEIISESNCETSTTTFENDTKIVVKLQDQEAVSRITSLDLKNSELDEVKSIENQVQSQPKPAKMQKKTTLAGIMESLEKETLNACYYCDKTFTAVKYLRLHHQRHLDSKGNYPCKYCEKTFPNLKAMNKHNYNKHTATKCELCGKVYSCDTAYRKHKKTVHGDKTVKNFKCDMCDYATHAQIWLNEHKRDKCWTTKKERYKSDPRKKSKDLDETTYPCSTCQSNGLDIIFDTQRALISHSRSKHGGLPARFDSCRKFICEQCDDEFLSSATLWQHKVRPYLLPNSFRFQRI